MFVVKQISAQRFAPCFAQRNIGSPVLHLRNFGRHEFSTTGILDRIGGLDKTRGWGDGAMGRRGDAGTGRRGDGEQSPCHRVSPSPHLPVTVSVITRPHARSVFARDPSPPGAKPHGLRVRYRLHQMRCTSTNTTPDFLHSNRNTHAATYPFHL